MREIARMPRHLRVEFPGAIHHVTIRGNGRQSIFGDERDRERFLRRLAESVETYGVRLYLFCLMTNPEAEQRRCAGGGAAAS